jgi:hypothetical protein
LAGHTSIEIDADCASFLQATYAGFEGESTLLEELYMCGPAPQQIGTDFRAGDGLLMFWSHTPMAAQV